MSTYNLDYLKHHARPIELEEDLSPLIEQMKDRKLVCLGDASHGTHEFYEWRMKISLELIKNHGFQFIAFEGDWPDFEKINDYVLNSEEETKKKSNQKSIDELLIESFRRWPNWMWANFEMKEFVQQLAQYNLNTSHNRRVGVHGLDLYSLEESKKRVCEIQDELERLEDLDNKKREWLLFDLRRNKNVVQDGLRYKQTSDWNVRDRHMMETLRSLFDFYGPESKGIVWAHINHVADFRKTDASSLSLGGLAREIYGQEAVYLFTFLTHSGEVIASPHWDGPLKAMPVPPAKEESIESAFHSISQTRHTDNLLLIFDKGHEKLSDQLSGPVPYRFVAVVYDPEKEHYENYIVGKLQDRFDAVFFIDKTEALKPIWPSMYLEENQFL